MAGCFDICHIKNLKTGEPISFFNQPLNFLSSTCLPATPSGPGFFDWCAGMDLNHQSCFSTGFTVRPAASYGLPTRNHLSLIFFGFLCNGGPCKEPGQYGRGAMIRTFNIRRQRPLCCPFHNTPIIHPGCEGRIRTGDFLINSQVPCQLGYLTAYYPLQHCPSPLPAIYYTRLLDTFEQTFGFI